jgi:hypothetical protein
MGFQHWLLVSQSAIAKGMRHHLTLPRVDIVWGVDDAVDLYSAASAIGLLQLRAALFMAVDVFPGCLADA